MVMFKKFVVTGLLFASITGCSTPNDKQDSKIDSITEKFVIISIDSENNVRGEIVKDEKSRTGEGIYYNLTELYNAGLKDVEIGDKVSITWSKEDYNSENWSTFIAKEVE
jgi:hypothetical protein